MSRPTTRLSVLDIVRMIQPEFPGSVMAETTAETIAAGIAYQIIGGQRKPTVKKPEEPARQAA